VGGSLEERVALPSTPAPGDDDLLAMVEHLGDDLTGLEVADNGARRYRHHQFLPGPPGLVRPHPVLATLRRPLVAIGVVEKRRHVRIAANENVAALPTVAAIRPAHGRAPFPAERGAPRSPGTGFDLHDDAINEHESI
jgi:hypothetical protein